MIQSFDPTFVENNVISGAKPFQKATIERVDNLFRDGQRRVLVADEVGLGKTVVARGVLAKMASRRKKGGKDIFRVAYICANQNIVSQNLKSLMKGFEEFANGDSSGTRLSMLPLVAELQERKLKDGQFIQIVPITPETSFRMGNRSGLVDERAIIFSMLKALDFSGRTLSKKLCTEEVKKERWRDLTKYYKKEIKGINKADRLFLRNFKCAFSDLDGFEVARQLEDNVGKSGDGIRELREIFAKIGAQRLHPDLVILDEFQRFRYLIDPPKGEDGKKEDGGEVKMLFDKFLRDDDKESDPPFVLMLSATPFKLNSTRKQDANDGRPVSYEEFKGVLEFLFGKDGDALVKCDDYSKALFEWAHSKPDDSARLADEALSAKEKVEEALRKGICRTERTLVEPYGQSVNALHVRLLPDPREIRSFHHYSQWAKSIGADNRLRIEYAKSAPYLLSFLKDYHEQKQLEKILTSKPEVLKNRKTSKEVRKSLWMAENKDLVKGYKRIDWANKRLELLADHAFAENTEQKPFHPEYLLWIPPTMPCYPLAGPFSGSAGYSKVLVFSSWQMVPKMAAVLLSYETERRTIAELGKNKREKLNYFKKERFPKPILRFRSEGRGSSPDTMSSDMMSLFTLLYPSKTLALALAETFSSVKALNDRDRCESAKSAAAMIAQELRDLLAKYDYPDPPDGDPDIKWYYLAPMLLDYSEGEDAKKWCNVARKEWRKKGNKKKFKGASAALNALKRQLEVGKKILGRRPDDLCEVLADMALGSPAVCLRRAGTDGAIATRLAEAFRNFFNSPEAIAAVDCSYSRSDDSHRTVLQQCKNILRYGRDGCLQSVIEEYLHMLSPGKALLKTEAKGSKKGTEEKDTEDAINAIESALSFRSAPYKIDTFEALKARISAVGGGSKKKTEKNEKDDKKMSMRTHFAAAVADGDGGGDEEKAVNRVKSLRNAFNSPFRPFVLASTSIGQEGLDFHWYCRKVFHWNLPHNPVDFEQREGRVDRYRGLVVRQNVADQFKDKHDFSKDIWTELFEAAEKAADDPSGLIPNWRNGPDAPWKIDRIVPLYSCSADEAEYDRITKVLARYRMAIGQSRQEDLLDCFMDVDPKTLDRFFLDLCPFRRNEKKFP